MICTISVLGIITLCAFFSLKPIKESTRMSIVYQHIVRCEQATFTLTSVLVFLTIWFLALAGLTHAGATDKPLQVIADPNFFKGTMITALIFSFVVIRREKWKSDKCKELKKYQDFFNHARGIRI